MDKIQIIGLVANTYIGVYEWEKQIQQRLLLDITLTTDFRACEENLEKTINYETLCKQVLNFVENKQFLLIETVADQVATFIKQEFLIDEVTVVVSKGKVFQYVTDIKVSVTR